MKERRLRTIEVKQEAQDAYHDELQRKLDGSVWMTGGCASWYLDAHGNNTTLGPDFTFRFRRQTKHFDLQAYTTTGQTPAPVAGNVDGVSA